MKAKLWTLCVISMLAVSCAKKDSSPSTTAESETVVPEVVIPPGPYTPPYQAPGVGDLDGASTPFVITNLSTMSDYTQRPMYNPQNLKINVNLVKAGSSFGGTVTISYTDYGSPYKGSFTSGTSPESTKYNVWFTKSGKKVYHGFFEDFYGAIVLVLDGIPDLGDGGTVSQDKISGSVWFKNHAFTYAPHPPTYCWFVALGPYDCRAWKSGKKVNTTAAINPDNGYVKLGTFDNLDLKKAFNNQLNF